MISASDVHRGKILIVDDQKANILLLERMLRGGGYVSVASTMDPREVCALHRNNRYDLILLDLEMPGMDGYLVMDELNEIEPKGYLPVIAVTAHPEQKLDALKAGVQDFVSKPFEQVELLLRVRNMLEVRLLHEAARDHGKALEALALNDPLTGLANRRLLSERMSIALAHARRNKSTMAVVCLDLDGFKNINDTLGHDAGDVLLKLVAARLLAAVRAEDTVARTGGDEFIIVLFHIGALDSAAAAARKVLEAVSRPYSIQEQVVSITASAGAAIYPAHGEDAVTLMKSADLALYEAKRAGKNAFRVAERAAPAAAAPGLSSGNVGAQPS